MLPFARFRSATSPSHNLATDVAALSGAAGDLGPNRHAPNFAILFSDLMMTLLRVGIVWWSIFHLILVQLGAQCGRATAIAVDLAPLPPPAGHVAQEHEEPTRRRLNAPNDVRGVGAMVFQQFSMLECGSGQFSDSAVSPALGALVVDPNLAECPPSTGVRVPSYKTTMQWALHWQNNNNALAGRVLSTRQYSIALWLRLDPSMPVTATAVEFFSLSRGMDWEDQIRGAISKNSAASASLLISAGLCYFEDCPTLSHTFPLPDRPLHVTVVVDGLSHTARLFLNAVQVAEREYGNDYNLVFATDSAGLMGVPSSLPGTLYSFAVYDRALTAEDVEANFASGITDSLALAVNTTMPFPEDGCVDCSDLSPEHFLSPFVVQRLQPVRCPYYDYDEAELELSTSGLCVLTALPDVTEAEIFDVNGRLINAVPYTFNDTSNGTFLVRPALNTNNRVVPIRFQMYDVLADVSSREAVLQLQIYPVNDPPIASAQALTAYLGAELRIFLGGTDVDGDEIVDAVIDSLPAKGELYVEDNNMMKVLLQPGDRVPVNQSVIYRYTSSPPPGWTAVVLAKEKFTFHVVDDHDTHSSSATIKVEVTTPLRVIDPSTKYNTKALQAAQAALDRVITEHSDHAPQVDSTVTLYSADLRSTDDCITHPELVFQSVPSQGALWVLDAEGNRLEQLVDGATAPMTLNTTIISTEDACVFQVQLNYVPPPFYFNTPSRTWDGHLIPVHFVPTITAAVRDATQHASIGAFTTISLMVINVASPVTVESARNTFTVAPFGDPSHEDRIEIGGFVLSDPDMGASPVVVEVRSSNQGGKISLNPLHVLDVQFNSQSLCRISANDERWRCRGSGHSDSFMRFVGSVSAVDRAINGMIYRSTDALQTDSVQVKVFRGVYTPGDATSAPCLDSSALADVDGDTLYNGCYVSEAAAEVTVSDYSWLADDDAARDRVIQNLGYGFVIGVTVLVLGQLARCCLSAVRCIKSARGSAVAARKKSPSDDSTATEAKADDSTCADDESLAVDDLTSLASREEFDPLTLVGVNARHSKMVWRMYRADDGGVYFLNRKTGERTCTVYPLPEDRRDELGRLTSCAV